jgi:hypothetical protein
MQSATLSQPRAIPAAAPAKQRLWSRLLKPSLSDLFFLFIATWMFLAAPLGWDRLLLDADTALHTRIGQYILATGSIPHRDLFSFSKPGEVWYAFEWLSETAYAWVFHLASFKGIVLLAGMTIALYFTVLLKYTIWKGANGLVALVVMLVAATATSVHFHARPHLFTLLLLACAVWIMEYNRKEGGWLIWILPPMTVLWANLHGGFFILFALLGLRVLGCAAESAFWTEQREARRREAIQLAGVGAACALASLVNPYGPYLHLHILDTLSSPWTMANVKEFLSPTFRSEEMLDYMFLLFAGLSCIAPLIRSRRIVEPLSIVFLGYASLVSVRHVPLFALFAAPVISSVFTEWWTGISAGRSRASLLGMLDDVSSALTARLPGTSLFIPLVIVVLAMMPNLHWPSGFPDGGGVPTKLIARHADLLATNRVFCSDQIADYLIFKNYPRQRVFFDSRHNYYQENGNSHHGENIIGDEYLALGSGAPNWRDLLDKYRFTVLLSGKSSPLVSLVKATGGWRVVDGDAKFTLMERLP